MAIVMEFYMDRVVAVVTALVGNVTGGGTTLDGGFEA